MWGAGKHRLKTDHQRVWDISVRRNGRQERAEDAGVAREGPSQGRGHVVLLVPEQVEDRVDGTAVEDEIRHRRYPVGQKRERKHRTAADALKSWLDANPASGFRVCAISLES